MKNILAKNREAMNNKRKNEFNIGEIVVYPKHGVGEIKSISTVEINKVKTKYYNIQMEQDKLFIRVPLAKQSIIGLRKILSKKKIEEVFNVLKQKPKVRKIMWSRRAQEYDAKIHSGDPVKIGEVIRDLFRKNNQPEQSYSERQLYELALDRLAREFAAVEKIDQEAAEERIEKFLLRAA